MSRSEKDKALAKVKSKLPMFTSITPLTQVKEFSGKNFINFTKKAGGQFFQYYSLFKDEGYEQTKYTETEVVFSRETFIKKVYHSKIFPILLREFILSSFSADASNNQKVVGETTMPPQWDTAALSQFSLTRFYVRDIRREVLNHDNYLRSSFSVYDALLRPGYRIIFLREERIRSLLQITKSYLKIGIISSDMTSDPLWMRSTFKSEYNWYLTHRQFDILKLQFNSAKDLTMFPKLFAKLTDPYGARINKIEKSLRLITRSSGVAFNVTSSTGTTVGTQPYKMVISYLVEDPLSEGTILSIPDRVLSISVKENKFSVNYRGKIVSDIEVPDYNKGSKVTLTIQNDGTEFKVVAKTEDYSQEVTLLTSDNILPLIGSTRQVCVLGNNKELNNAYRAIYLSLDYVISDLDALDKRPESLATKLSVENSTLKVEGSPWKVLDNAVLKLGEDYIDLDGTYTLQSEYREDLSIDYDNNYRIVFEFEPTRKPFYIIENNGPKYYKEYLLYQPSEWGTLSKERETVGALTHEHEGYAVFFTRAKDGSENVNMHIKMGSLTFEVYYDIPLHQKTKVEMVKYRNNVFVFINDDLITNKGISSTYEIPGVSPSYISGKYPETNSNLSCKLYSLEMINFYEGDSRLLFNKFNRNYINLAFEGENIIDLGDPSRKWMLQKGAADFLGDSLRFYRERNANNPIRIERDLEMLNIVDNDYTIDFTLKDLERYSNTINGFTFLRTPSDIPFTVNVKRDEFALYERGSNSFGAYARTHIGTRTDFILEDPEEYHFAVTRKNGTTFLYINGKLKAQTDKYKDTLLNFNIRDTDMVNRGHYFGPSYYIGTHTIKNFRVVKGEALFHDLPRYDLDKMFFTLDRKAIVLDEDLLLWLCPSNREVAGSSDNKLSFLPKYTYKRFIEVTYELFNASSTNVTPLAELYLEKPLFTLNTAIDRYVVNNYTLEVLFKYEGVFPLPVSFDTSSLQEGKFYNLVITRDNSTLHIFIDGVLKSSFQNNDKSINISNLVSYSQIRFSDGVVLYKNDFDPSHTYLRDVPFYIVSLTPWTVFKDTNTNRSMIYPKNSDSDPQSNTYKIIENDVLNLNKVGVALNFKHEPFRKELYRISDCDKTKNFLMEINTPREIKSNIVFRGDEFNLRHGRAKIDFNYNGIRAQFSSYYQDGKTYNTPLNIEEIDKAHLCILSNWGEESSINSIDVTQDYPIEQQVFLRHTDSYNKIPYNSFFEYWRQNEDQVVEHSYDSVVRKRSCYFSKDVGIFMPDVSVDKEEITIEGWFKILQAGYAPLFKMFSNSTSVSLEAQTGVLAIVVNEQSHQLDIPITINHFFHLRVEIEATGITVYINGNKIEILQVGVNTIDTYQLSFNSDNPTNNNEFIIDDFKFRSSISREDEFDPFDSIYYLNNYEQNYINFTEEFIYNFESNEISVLDYSNKTITHNQDYSFSSKISLDRFGGYSMNPSCLMFTQESEERFNVEVLYKDISGSTLYQYDKVVLPKEKSVFIPNVIPSDEVSHLEFRFYNCKANTSIKDINFIMEEPIYTGKLVDTEKTFIFEEDNRPHMHYNERE